MSSFISTLIFLDIESWPIYGLMLDVNILLSELLNESLGESMYLGVHQVSNFLSLLSPKASLYV